jgi:hypothetical protein
VTFNNPPINLIDHTMIRELSELFPEIEKHKAPAVLVFDSADPDLLPGPLRYRPVTMPS